MKAIVDAEKCVGCTLCTQICPEVFKMVEDKAISYVDAVPQAVAATCRDAADQCPVEAITIE